jgi:hypothetical protein
MSYYSQTVVEAVAAAKKAIPWSSNVMIVHTKATLAMPPLCEALTVIVVGKGPLLQLQQGCKDQAYHRDRAQAA